MCFSFCIASIALSHSDFILAGYLVAPAPADRHLSITPLQAKFKFQSDKMPSLSKKISGQQSRNLDIETKEGSWSLDWREELKYSLLPQLHAVSVSSVSIHGHERLPYAMIYSPIVSLHSTPGQFLLPRQYPRMSIYFLLDALNTQLLRVKLHFLSILCKILSVLSNWSRSLPKLLRFRGMDLLTEFQLNEARIFR